MKNYIISVVVVILFYQTASAQILRPFPEPDTTNLLVKSSEIPGISFLFNDSATEFYLCWVDSIYDIYPNCLVRLPDGVDAWTIELESLDQIKNIEQFIKSKTNENPSITISQIIAKIYKTYLWGNEYKLEWTKYLHIL